MKTKLKLFVTLTLTGAMSLNFALTQPTLAETAPQPDPNLSDRIAWINSQLDGIDQVVKNFVSNWTSIFKLIPIDQGIINDANSLSQLVSRLLNYPSEVSGWWNIITNAAVGEYNDCASVVSSLGSGQTPAFVPDPDWCIFSRQKTVDQDGNPVTEMPGLHSPEGPFGDPSGKKTETLVENSTNIGQIAKNAMGVAGVPDLMRMRLQAFDQVNDGNYIDNFVNSKQIRTHFAGQSVDRGFATYRAQAVLSDYGQVTQQATLSALQGATMDAVSSTETALQSDVTQDVMKGLAKAQVNSSFILGSIAASQQREINDNAVTALQLANISRAMDVQNRQRFTDRTASQASLIYRVSQGGLF